jgi:hypothetical protein
MKRRELLWMILPCIALTLIAIALRGRRGANLLHDNDDFALVVEKVERDTPTPEEVAKGYDSRLTIVLNHRGPKPGWWGKSLGYAGQYAGARLMFKDGGALHPVKLPPDFKRPAKVFLWHPRWDSERERYVARILMHLSDVPPRPGSIVAEAQLQVKDNFQKPLSAPLRVAPTAREAGEVIKTPLVSRNPGCKVERIEVEPLLSPIELRHRAATSPRADTRVTITLLADKDIRKSEGGGVIGTLRDEHGGKWRIVGASSGSFRAKESDPRSESLSNRRYGLSFDCVLKSIPARAGRVWLETETSLNTAWPISIRIPVRDAQGKIIYSPTKPAH